MSDVTFPVDRDIPQGSYDSIRELLVMTVNDAPTPHRSRRRVSLVAAATTLTLLGGAGAAVALGDPAVFRNGNGVTVVNTQQLKVVYRGQTISQDALSKLQAKHQGMFTSTNVRDAKAGVMHAFDTERELNTYRDQYLAWARAQVAAHSASPAPTSSSR